MAATKEAAATGRIPRFPSSPATSRAAHDTVQAPLTFSGVTRIGISPLLGCVVGSGGGCENRSNVGSAGLLIAHSHSTRAKRLRVRARHWRVGSPKAQRPAFPAQLTPRAVSRPVTARCACHFSSVAPPELGFERFAHDRPRRLCVDAILSSSGVRRPRRSISGPSSYRVS